MLLDVWMALRSLRRSPGFTVTTVLSLALASGASAAILAVAFSLLLKPLPYRDPASLVSIWPQQFQSMAHLQFTRERASMLDGVASIAPGWTMSMTGVGEPAKITVGRVSPNMFAVLGAEPLLGRTFTDANGAGSAATIVLSHRLWVSRFGADPQVVGRAVSIDGAPVVITAVMPRSFDILNLRSDAYSPFPLDEKAWYHRLSFSFFVGRLADGLSLDQASRDYTALMQELKRQQTYRDDFGRDARLMDLREAVVGDMRATLALLAAAVGLILLIAAANVAALQMTRATARARDVAIRTALGASPARALRGTLVETLVIALAAAALGIAAAYGLVPALAVVLPPATPRLVEIQMNLPVALAVTVSVVGLTLLIGLVPAASMMTSIASPSLQSPRTTDTRSAKRTRGALVSAEVAFAVALTIGAGLMLRTLWNLQAVDPGFRAGGLLTAHIQPSGASLRNASVAAYYARVLERVRGLPGVEAAGAIQHLPFSGYSWTTPVEVDGQITPAGAPVPTVETRIVTPGYFSAVGQPILAGRDVEPQDASRPDVVLVNAVFATRFFGSETAALGKGLRTRGNRPGPRMTIVGVVGNVRHNGLTRDPGPEIYSSVAENTIPAMMLAVRAGVDPRSLIPALRDGIHSVDADVPISDIQLMDAKIAASLGRPRLLLSLLSAFSMAGLLLAVIGVYGVVAYSVTQRRPELAIKVALGAERKNIVSGIVREVVPYGVGGLAVGLAIAVASGRLMRSLIWGVSTVDPLTYGLISGGAVVLVVAASLGPARRAMRVDPAEALKGS